MKGLDLKDKMEFLGEISRRFTVKSGAKFGSEFRLYSGKDKHSRILLNIKDNEDAVSMIAKARVSHSVKKELVYCFHHEEGIRCLSIRWLH